MELIDAKMLALTLMQTHNLSGWGFKFDNSVRRFGQCDLSRKVISLSKRLVALNESHAVEHTIRHEIAHALAGPGHGHDWVWRAWAVKLGIEPVRCYNERSYAVAAPKPKYQAVCACAESRVNNRAYQYFRRKRLRCRRCKVSFTYIPLTEVT